MSPLISCGVIVLGAKHPLQDTVDRLVKLFHDEQIQSLVSDCTDWAAVNVGAYNGIMPGQRHVSVIGDSLVHILCSADALENSAKSANRTVP